jgi:hypothetical protein
LWEGISMRATILALSMLVASTSVAASEMIHQFSSPAFSGIGYSTHVLTIEQLESNRKQKNKDDEQAAIDKADRDYKSTNAYKFKNNLESRVYATLSKQIADNMFGEGATIADGTWYSSETPFGDNVSWKRDDGRIYVVIKDSNGDTVAEFDVPVGEFAF